MEYSIQGLAKLAGISTRTLRYYDEIGLLKPLRINSSGYRIYGPAEVDALQQILFFRALGMGLAETQKALCNPNYDRLHTLRNHLSVLHDQRQQLDQLIENVTRTIASAEGSPPMKDTEKFKGMKKQMIDENERKYGEEIRQKYGEDTVKKSNARFMNLSEADYERMQALATEMQTLLEQAVQQNLNPAGPEGAKIAQLHKDWLGFTWGEYSKEAHAGLAQMYVDDTSFTAHYDANVPGCAVFIRDAIHAWLK